MSTYVHTGVRVYLRQYTCVCVCVSVYVLHMLLAIISSAHIFTTALSDKRQQTAVVGGVVGVVGVAVAATVAEVKLLVKL